AKLRRMRDEEEQRILTERKASVFCDMAVVKLRLCDENKAVELLISSELTYYNKRAVRMRYLVNGSGELGDNEKAELDEIKRIKLEEVRRSPAYAEISSLFEKDSIKILKESRNILSRWKNNYRKM
ncbi:MAG: hypothetical protein Q4E57_10200, partial [Eubacteriales bacterium]|nr:hypothetical protein [Eubacteriales bacterium]